VTLSLAEAASSRSEELWLVSLAVGSLAIVLLAVLFGLVIAVLQRIDRHAARTHTAAKQIAQNTVALWTLEQTNRDLIAIRDAARGATRAGAASALAGPLSAVSQKVHDVLGRAEPRDDGSS
jgi:type II secretory pathway component PulJ